MHGHDLITVSLGLCHSLSNVHYLTPSLILSLFLYLCFIHFLSSDVRSCFVRLSHSLAFVTL